MVASVGVGAHLPSTVPASQELVVECFCRESVHHCWPGNQTVRVEGREPLARDWSPDTAAHMVAVFVDALHGRPVPEGFVTDDAAALALAETLQGTGAPSLI